MSDKVRFVGGSVVLAIHGKEIDRHGGRDGLRDPGGLQAALARPRHLAVHGTPDLADLAAAYAFAIAKAHAFADGNKRTAWIVARLFLADNGTGARLRARGSGGGHGRARRRHAVGAGACRLDSAAPALRPQSGQSVESGKEIASKGARLTASSSFSAASSTQRPFCSAKASRCGRRDRRARGGRRRRRRRAGACR